MNKTLISIFVLFAAAIVKDDYTSSNISLNVIILDISVAFIMACYLAAVMFSIPASLRKVKAKWEETDYL